MTFDNKTMIYAMKTLKNDCLDLCAYYGHYIHQQLGTVVISVHVIVTVHHQLGTVLILSPIGWSWLGLCC